MSFLHRNYYKVQLRYTGREIANVRANSEDFGTVNVLKFLTLYSFSSQITWWLSGLESTTCLSEDPDQTASSESV